MLVPIVKIIPQLFPTPLEATMASVNNIQVIPGQGASGSVSLGNLNLDGVFVPIHSGTYTVALTEQQFADWGADDTVAVMALVQNLGLTIAN